MISIFLVLSLSKILLILISNTNRMEVYLLEIYENNKAVVPDFGLIFKSMDLLLKFVEHHIKKLQPEDIEFAHELKETALALSLDAEETVRVTILPVIDDFEDNKYNDYLHHKKTVNLEHGHEQKPEEHKTEEHKTEEHKTEEHKTEEHKTEEHKPAEHTQGQDKAEDHTTKEEDDSVEITESKDIIELPEGSVNTLIDEELKDDDTIIDFYRNKDRKGNPRYMLKSTFDSLNSPKKDPWTIQPIHEATTYKIRIAKKNLTKKNKNSRDNVKK